MSHHGSRPLHRSLWRALLAAGMSVAVSLVAPCAPAMAWDEPSATFDDDFVDRSFGVNGVAVFDDSISVRKGFALDDQGRSYVSSGEVVATGTTPWLRRLSPDGSVDPGFAGGQLTLPEPNKFLLATAGSTVTAAAVRTGVAATTFHTLIHRYVANGDPDSDFGVGGTVDIDNGQELLGLAERPGGGLVLAFWDSSAFPGSTVLTALTSTGQPDPTWVPGGPTPGRVALPDYRIWAIGVDGEKVLTSGKGDMQPGIYTMYRLTGDGAPDLTFGNAGALILPSPFTTVTNGITVSGGAYFLAGRVRIGIALDAALAVAKITSIGTMDAAFGTGGVAHGPLQSCGPDGQSALVTPTGVYVVGHRLNCPGILLVDRFDAAGQPATYGSSNEIGIQDLGGGNASYVNRAVMQGDRILVSLILGGAAASDNALARLYTQAPVAGSFVPLTPARILDTRMGNGAPAGAVPPGASIDLLVTGRGGVPGTGVGAVVMNVTVTQPTAGGFVTVYPAGVAAPLASNLNFDAGQTIPNLVTVKIGTGGKVTLKNGSSGTVHLVADVAGYYVGGTPTLAGTFVPLEPARILDTRKGTGAPMAPVAAGASIDVQVAEAGGVPASGVAAVVMNVTVTQPTANGFITAYPTGQSAPLASNLNFGQGQTIPNLVTVKLGTNGKVSLKNGSGGSVQLVADVAGYYLDGTPTMPGTFVPLTPSRILDTRNGTGAPTGPVPGGASVYVQVTGAGGVPLTGVSAAVMNLTVTQPTSNGFVTAYPSGFSAPLASNLNFVSGQTIPNLVAVKTGTDGMVGLKNGSAGSIQLVADVAGYFIG